MSPQLAIQYQVVSLKSGTYKQHQMDSASSIYVFVYAIIITIEEEMNLRARVRGALEGLEQESTV